MDPFVGEIRMFGGTFAPVGWKFCDGSLLNISDYDKLFALIGITYGGDGQSTFALPDLRGRAPVHTGTSNTGTRYLPGQFEGSETVTLLTNQLPIHTHIATAYGGAGGATTPSQGVWAGSTDVMPYNTVADSNMGGGLSPVGGSQPHENRPPYLAISFIIAMEGIYPSRS